MEFEEWLFDDINSISDKKLNSHNEVMIYPGHVKFLNIAKSKGLKLEPLYKSYPKYKSVIGYNIKKEHFEICINLFLQLRKKTLEEFYNLPDLLKLILVLQKTFYHNMKAHNNHYYSRKIDNFREKTKLIKFSGYLSSLFQYPFFKYGYQDDPGTPGYPYIVYFQIFDDQVSFHTNSIQDCFNRTMPVFDGKWNGLKLIDFPMSIQKVKKRLKELNIDSINLQKTNLDYYFCNIEKIDFDKFYIEESKKEKINTQLTNKKEERKLFTQITIDEFLKIDF